MLGFVLNIFPKTLFQEHHLRTELQPSALKYSAQDLVQDMRLVSHMQAGSVLQR